VADQEAAMPETVIVADAAHRIRCEEYEEDQAQRQTPGFDAEPAEGEVEDIDEEETEDGD